MSQSNKTVIGAKAVIVGGGTMGADVAVVLTRGGFVVTVVERDAARRAGIRSHVAERLGDVGLAQRAESLGLAADLAEVDWPAIDLVIECIPEQLALKQPLFAELERLARPDCVLTSNSSSFPISAIAEGLASQQRMYGLHFFMPAHLVPLVEVVLGEDSDPLLGEAVCELYRRSGKRPVLVRKDIPGFLANRIQHALMREALSLIDSGIASAADVDTAVRYSFGFRYAAAGPVLQKEISGWDSMARAAVEIYPSLSNSATLADCVAERIAAGKTGMKAGAGFMEWPADKAAAERAAYEKRLKASFAVLNMVAES